MNSTGNTVGDTVNRSDVLVNGPAAVDIAAPNGNVNDGDDVVEDGLMHENDSNELFPGLNQGAKQ